MMKLLSGLNPPGQSIRIAFKSSLIALLAGVSLLAGCSHVRVVAYPSDFVWIEPSDVQSVMHVLARSINRIDNIATDGSQIATMQILTELDKMISAADTLMAERAVDDDIGRTAPRTNHFLIDEHLGDFIERLNTTRSALQYNPDNLYAVGNLIGQCAACHRLR